MYYVYQVEGKKHVQMNFSTSASQHKEILVEEQCRLATLPRNKLLSQLFGGHR